MGTTGGVGEEDVRMLRLIAFGDSTTAPREGVDVYTACLQRDLPRMGSHAEIHNAGVGGNTTEAGRTRFAADVLDRHPSIAVIQFGINDSTVDVWGQPPAAQCRVSQEQYAKNLVWFVSALHQRNCMVILMTPNPLQWTPELKKMYGQPPYRSADPDGFNVMLRAYADSVRMVARQTQARLVDVDAAFRAHGAIEGQSTDDLLLDGMHPNSRGHRIVADLLIREIARHPARFRDLSERRNEANTP